MKKLIKKIVKFFHLPIFWLDEIFTPSTAATINYIKRNDIDRKLVSEMETPGKQLIVYGHSGSGKTSSVRNMLNKKNLKYIRTNCESNTSFEELILNAFDALDIYVISEKSHKRIKKQNRNLAIEYSTIKASISKSGSTEDTLTFSPLLPPQLTVQKLAQFMGKLQIVWIIEDFHKVTTKEKQRIADVIKIFVDNANDYPLSKIVCIGACQSAHELMQLDSNLKNRVSEISIPLLKEEEIKQIITNGFNLLRAKPDKRLVEQLVYYSDRLGAAAHQMCLDICKGSNLNMTQWGMKDVLDSSFQYAIDGFISNSSDSLKTIYESATKDELGWYVLKTFSRNTMDNLSLTQIYKIINAKKIKFSEEEIQVKLSELSDPPFNIIYYKERSSKYTLSNPFWHRFLRLQFSIEHREHQKKKKNNQNPNLKLIDKDVKYQMVDKIFLDLIIKELTKNKE